ncbi:MAG: penicillin-binding transpeptidase domain-containing protein, partial [Actinomycetota bacterium]|nr:penicillin-binding transpeptidase domain-containing protein [Actinomycetota bacterium]
MIGGEGFQSGQNEVNMALAPRQTGSSAKLFILAAAVQAGAHPGDIIEGSNPCEFPIPDQPGEVFEITDDAVGGGLFTLEQNTYDSINCAYVRLSQIVGLNRVVDTTYRMAESPYLSKDQSSDDRRQLQPLLSFATGANELSTLDMAAGAQTIANEGVHHKPYYVDRVETIDGQTLYTHFDDGAQVLDREVALTTIDILKQVLGPDGTAYRYPLAGDRPAAGKTGTQQDNTNATFVGFTPELSTAVWIGDPNGYTEMTNANVPEFTEFDSVQGGRYPALIWKTFMDPALADSPVTDWPAPPPQARFPARLFLPGDECVTRIVRYETRVIGEGIGGGDQPMAPNGFVTPVRAPEPPPGTDPPGQTTA